MRTMQRITLAAFLGALLACGGSEEGDPPDLPGVDASGTADTDLFTNDPDGEDSLQGYTPAPTDTTGGDTTAPPVQTHAP